MLLTVSVLVAGVSAFRALRDPASRWLGLLFVQQLIGAQVSGTLYLSQSFWAMLLLVIGSDATRRQLGDWEGGVVVPAAPQESQPPIRTADT